MTLTQTADRAALIEELAQADFSLDVGYAEIAYTQELRKTGSEPASDARNHLHRKAPPRLRKPASGLTIAHNARRTRWEALYISDLVICQVAVIVRSAGTAAAVAAKRASIF